MVNAQSLQPQLSLAAVCGLFCPSCFIYIATRETPENRVRFSELFGIPLEKLYCDGCRSKRRYAYCASCKMAVCSAEKGVDFCGSCPEYPCEELKKFQEAMPHRLELWEAHSRIRQFGYEQWFEEMLEHFACPECGILNSAYDLQCRSCGAVPASGYTACHGETVCAFLEENAG